MSNKKPKNTPVREKLNCMCVTVLQNMRARTRRGDDNYSNK